MQIDTTFSGRNPKLRSKTWGIDEVMHPSRKSEKDNLWGRLRLLRLVVLQPGGASTDTKQTHKHKNVEVIWRSLISACFMSVQNYSKSFSVKVMYLSCWNQQENKLEVSQTIPKLNALCQLYCSITEDVWISAQLLCMHLSNASSQRKKKGGGEGEKGKTIPDNETAEQLVIWKMVSYWACNGLS